MRAKYLLLVVITLLVSVMTIEKCCADDVLKIKQSLGASGAKYYWYHVSSWLFTEIINDTEKNRLDLGMGPTFKIGSFNNYFIPAIEFSTNSPHFPLTSLILDIITENKDLGRLSVFSRHYQQGSKKLDSFVWKGRDYIQYKIADQINLGIQDERIYQDKISDKGGKWTFFLGSRIEYHLKNKMVLTGFVSIKTSRPFEKMIWWELKYKI